MQQHRAVYIFANISELCLPRSNVRHHPQAQSSHRMDMAMKKAYICTLVEQPYSVECIYAKDGNYTEELHHGQGK